jgi:hypothetical protein
MFASMENGLDDGFNGSKRLQLVGYGRLERQASTTDPKQKHQWPRIIWDAIQDGVVALGMTEEQVRMSWGEPKNIFVTSTAAGKSEQWVFASGAYVYFTGGLVSGIQGGRSGLHQPCS